MPGAMIERWRGCMRGSERGSKKGREDGHNFCPGLCNLVDEKAFHI